MREEEEGAAKKKEEHIVVIRRLEAKEEATEEAGAAHIRGRGAASVEESCASETKRDTIHVAISAMEEIEGVQRRTCPDGRAMGLQLSQFSSCQDERTWVVDSGDARGERDGYERFVFHP